MNIKPILFNTDMVHATWSNRKTATRRVAKSLCGANIPPWVKCCFVSPRSGTLCWGNEPDGQVLIGRNPVTLPCRPGDILYVRETWTKLWYVDPNGYTHFDQPIYYYAADGTPDITLYDEDGFELEDQRIRWHPSIHMPREAARLFLRVTNVWAEQLYRITGAQARAEGFLSRDAFIRAFLTMHPDCTMKSWVWVIEFERCEKLEAVL